MDEPNEKQGILSMTKDAVNFGCTVAQEIAQGSIEEIEVEEGDNQRDSPPAENEIGGQKSDSPVISEILNQEQEINDSNTSQSPSGKEEIFSELPKDVSKAKGTGKEHVYSTGFAADGGDFDATQPGAGIEARRLSHNTTESFENVHGCNATSQKFETKSSSNIGHKLKRVFHKQ